MEINMGYNVMIEVDIQIKSRYRFGYLQSNMKEIEENQKHFQMDVFSVSHQILSIFSIIITITVTL